MNVKFLQQIQSSFKVKLRAIRDDQLDAAEQRKYAQRVEWESHLKRCRAWKTFCFVKEDFMEDKKIEPIMLVPLLRKLAGVSYGGKGVRTGSDYIPGGLDGPRKCGEENWDRAVRAMEDDR